MSSMPAAKKMKGSPPHERAEPALGKATDAPAFVDMPDDAMLIIAQFAAPPDVYNLCLTNQERFFRSAGNDAGASTTIEEEGRGANAPDALFCTKLLRFSLLSSLSRVLRNSAAGLSLEQVSFSNMPRGSVILTGSTIVQCCLGELWKGSDLDIFCTTGIAPAVRSWLIKDAGQMFQGFCEGYLVTGVESYTHPIDSKIHHVEYYCPLPEEGEEDYGFQPFDYKQACVYGKHVHKEYVRDRWQYLLKEAGIKDVTSRKYRIQPLAGDPFPFNFDYGTRHLTAFDLIVATDECSTAAELLDDFDLNVCKASWDGETFSIPDPHYTFTRRSKMEPTRKAVLESYMRHYEPNYSAGGYLPNDILHRVLAAMNKVAADLPNSPFCRNMHRRQHDKYLLLQFHNFVNLLFHRLKKYKERGIQVEDAPDQSNADIRYMCGMELEF